MSTGYRFYLLEGEHIAAVRACDCTTDADALLEADAELRASKYLAVEVWSGPRRVGLLSKPTEKSDRLPDTMPYRADLELARQHLQEIEGLIVRQNARMEHLRWEGVSDASALEMLDFLTRSRIYLLEYIEQATKANE